MTWSCRSCLTRTKSAIYRDLHARGTVDGVIVHAPRMNDPRIAAAATRSAFPSSCTVAPPAPPTPYSWVDVNNRRAFQRATEFLLDLGHRRIALVNGLEFMDFAIRRRTGYARCADRAAACRRPCPHVVATR